jgi:hypothetical protein
MSRATDIHKCSTTSHFVPRLLLRDLMLPTRRQRPPISSCSNDPVFYLNHCNVDRIWRVWLQEGRSLQRSGSGFYREVPTEVNHGSNIQVFPHGLVGSVPQTKFLNADGDWRANSLGSHRQASLRMHFRWTLYEKGCFHLWQCCPPHCPAFQALYSAFRRPTVIPSPTTGVIPWRLAMRSSSIGGQIPDRLAITGSHAPKS